MADKSAGDTQRVSDLHYVTRMDTSALTGATSVHPHRTGGNGPLRCAPRARGHLLCQKGVEPQRPNTLIAFAAKGGSTAADGDNRNSPFTTALLKHLAKPGLELGKAFRLVRDDVMNATGDAPGANDDASGPDLGDDR